LNETRRASSNRLRIATTREAQLAELVARSPVRLGRDNVLHGPSDGSASARERSPLRLRALLDAGTVLSSVRGLAALGRPLLDLIFDVIRAERGALLLTGAEPHTVVAAQPPAPDPSESSPLLVSRTMVERALRDVVALSSNDVRMSRRAGGARGARRSVMVAPVVAFDEPLGVVYLETQDEGVRFTEDDLRLLAMLAGMAALAIENFSYGERLDYAAHGSHRRLALDDDMVGHSGAIQEVHRCIARAAPTDATVLIRGESGTGKELVARAIHRNSTRCTRPFIAISCAAIPETLLESELFGHEQGAFTGAVRQKKGKLELADGGTLFLDEVGELPVTLQPKLLRVLQERVFERVGGTAPIRVDIRLIAATNASLEAAVKRGTFRSDLYYRLHVVPIEIPPLRERRDDIVQLAEFMAARCAERLRQPVKAITPAAAALLMQYDWPGNVRELENAVERAVVLGSGPVLAPEDLPREIRENRRVNEARGGPYRAAMLRARRDLIVDAFRQAGGSYVEAAHLLGVHPNYLHRLIRTLDLKAALRQIH
jgi:Nif-specific regulatory protein